MLEQALRGGIHHLLGQRIVETYALGSAEKIGAAFPYTVLPLKDAAAVITDAADSPIVAQLKRAGTHIIAARG